MLSFYVLNDYPMMGFVGFLSYLVCFLFEVDVVTACMHAL